MQPHESKLREQLAEIGLEKTPDEVVDLIRDTVALSELVDEPCYHWLKNMTPGGIWLEARRRQIPFGEFMDIREMLIIVYERIHDIPKKD